MYLARKTVAGKTHYVIRESFQERDSYLCRDLYELGAEPQRFIIYPGGNAFYIDEVVMDGLRSQGTEATQDEMETLFWPFLRPDLQYKLEPFRRQESRLKSARRMSAPEDPSQNVHRFDQRRVFFLKTGRIVPQLFGRLPAFLWRRLQNKSRDEIEQDFLEMESILKPREYKIYTYAIFDLQNFFHQRFAKSSPELLDQDDLDAYFIQEICRLQEDRGFWAGLQPGQRLSDYLVRYVVMYFDHDFSQRSTAAEYIQDFMNRHRAYRPPPSVVISLQEIVEIFGKSREILKKMSRRELWRLYRRRAQELHPDKGGEHERFVKLNEAYHKLLRTKHG
jgi:hypothetical protein